MKRKINLTESQFAKIFENLSNEEVYAASISNRGRGNAQIELGYSKGRHNGKRLSDTDYLNTDKMDNNGHDTYEVPLKGGYTSYNITSIHGTEIMHYFKRKFAKNEDTFLKVKNEQGEEAEFKLKMKDEEYSRFVQQFFKKVNNVISWKMDEFKEENPDSEFSTVSIYPVPSSSRFNDEMAKAMTHYSFCGLKNQVINKDILKKGLENIERDEEFISHNKEYYNSYSYNANPYLSSINTTTTHNQSVNTALNRINAIKKAQENIFEFNAIVTNMVKLYSSINHNSKNINILNRKINDLTQYFKQGVDLLRKMSDDSEYYSEEDNKTHRPFMSNIINSIKYGKQPSAEANAEGIYDLIKKNLRGSGYGKKDMFDMMKVQKKSFQIKNYLNDVRMALKGYYTPNSDDTFVKNELDKAMGSVFVIFDDNVSGGATLSDIVMQLSKLGIKYIIPITFGEMAQKWGIAGMPQLIKPVSPEGVEGRFNTNYKFKYQ